jgi:glyceraldehyde-3-phosphate dehydrogenase (NADP+)
MTHPDPDTLPLGTQGILHSGQEHFTGTPYETVSPFNDKPVAQAHLAGPAEVELALASIARGFHTTKRLSGHERSSILERVAAGIEGASAAFAQAIALEAGKPIGIAKGEVSRAVFTFKVASEEARRIGGEVLPLDWLPGLDGSRAEVRRVPLGPITAITPFNFPLNLVAHKIAPAMAAGNPIALRPDHRTPTAAVMLGRIIQDAGWPADGLAIMPTAVEHAAPFVQDDRSKLFTFTGSPTVGWMLKNQAGRKRVALELGGNAGTLVHHDADLDWAAERVAWGGFTYSGQSCISVQRVLVHEDVLDTFAEKLVDHLNEMKSGDPMDPTANFGPVIDRSAAERMVAWIHEAVEGGATLLTGGKATGALVEPTVLLGASKQHKVVCEEVFGPVVTLLPYSDAHQALKTIDDSDFGLQAGLFTNDYSLVETAFDTIEVGGLVVNDVSTFRVDHMPYGGVKASGFGKEGLRSAIHDMTEEKLLIHRKRPTS